MLYFEYNLEKTKKFKVACKKMPCDVWDIIFKYVHWTILLDMRIISSIHNELALQHINKQCKLLIERTKFTPEFVQSNPLNTAFLFLNCYTEHQCDCDFGEDKSENIHVVLDHILPSLCDAIQREYPNYTELKEQCLGIMDDNHYDLVKWIKKDHNFFSFEELMNRNQENELKDVKKAGNRYL